MEFPAVRSVTVFVAASWLCFAPSAPASAQTSLGTTQNGVPFQACCETCNADGTCSTCTDVAHQHCGGGAFKANCTLFDDELTCTKASNIAPLNLPGTNQIKRRN